MEIWEEIKDYEGIYEVSDLGNVRSLNYNRIRILKPSINKSGYLSVVLSKNGNCKTISIHQLVAFCFLNHTHNKKETVVNHINFTKTDNRLVNLEIVSFRENTNRKHLKSSSIYTGVVFHKQRNKWMASINIKGKNKYLGLFLEEINAHYAYEKALKELPLY